MDLTASACRRFTRAIGTYNDHALAQREICQHLARLWSEVEPESPAGRKILEVGCGGGGLTRWLLARERGGEWVLNDLCESWRPALERLMVGRRATYLFGDAETLPLGEDYGLVATASAVQWLRDQSAFVTKLAHALRPGGLLLLSTFGPDNLKEVRALTGEGLAYAELSSWRRWVERDFVIERLEERFIPLAFADPLDVLRHMRYTGVTGTSSSVWTPGRLNGFLRAYRARFGVADGRVVLTYHPLFVIARRKETIV